MDRNVKAAVTLLENQFIAPLTRNNKSVEETIIEPLVDESQDVIEEEEGYISEDTDVVMDGALFEEGTHVGEHVGFRYRSAHPEGRIAKIVRDALGKIKKVFIRPDKKDRHPGESAEVSRRAGKFHAIAEAKDDENDFGRIIRNHPIASKHFNDQAHEDDSSSYYHKHDRHTRIIHDLQPDGGHTVEVQGYDFSGKGRDKNPKTALDRAIQQYETNRKIRAKSVKPIKLSEDNSSLAETKDSKDDEGALKYVKKMNGKWALYSIHSGKALKYFDEKPTKEEADKALRAIEFFSNHR